MLLIGLFVLALALVGYIIFRLASRGKRIQACWLSVPWLLVLAYGIFTIWLHGQAVPAILAYLKPGYPELTSADLSISSLPMPTSSLDMRIVYFFVYNEHGESLSVPYYWRNTRPINAFK